MYLGKGSKAVGGAASIGDDVNVGLVLGLIHTNNEHRCILAGSRDDHLLGTTLQLPNKISL
jgi:hypothetical protein